MVSVWCPLMPSRNTCCLTWVSLTLDVGYLFSAVPAKHRLKGATSHSMLGGAALRRYPASKVSEAKSYINFIIVFGDRNKALIYLLFSLKVVLCDKIKISEIHLLYLYFILISKEP